MFELNQILDENPREKLLDTRAKAIKKVVDKRQSNLTLVLDNIHDPHNIAAILRTCDAVGVFEVYVIFTEYPKVIKGGNKSSASANKWVKVHLFSDKQECINVLKSKGYQLISTHLSSDSKSLFDINFNQKVAIVMGSEQKGVSDELLSSSIENMNIPQIGMLESLNVSVATSIVLYEALRQRQESGYINQCQLSEDEKTSLFNYYSWM